MPTGDRDRVVDQLLRNSAGDLLAAPGPDCVDAETLAAWSEGGLDAEASQRMERHLATCAPCQTMAAAFVRSEVSAPAPARATWGLRWLVPVAVAAAAALAIWVLVPRPPAARGTGQTMAMNDAPAVPAPPPAASAPVPVPEAAPVSTNGPESTTRADARERAEMKSEAAAAPSVRDDASNAAGTARGSVGRGTPPPPPAAVALPPPPAPQPAGQHETVQVTAEAPVIQAQSGERSFSVTTTQVENLPVNGGNLVGVAAAAPGRAPADAPARETRVGGAGQNNIQMDGVSPMGAGATARIVAEFAAPSVAAEPAFARSAGRAGGAAAPEGNASAPTTRWRVLADGRVQRSLTGGASWDAIAIDSTLGVTTGRAPSTMVCWLIGPGGVVLRATDRLHFERLPFPEAVDLTAIRAASDVDASVTTRDGRTFATTDGGRTWRPER